ncbi:hypothetical protein [Endozoicomonas atrinae]|uniref:hypothetical protein n=1 Tax=Endozoicomonas atrinae TaxID=1333660 RepID=UPI003B004AA4
MKSHHRLISLSVLMLMSRLLTLGFTRQRNAFVTPPSVIRFYQGHWQTGANRQRQSTAIYSTSRPVSTSRSQSSQQAKPLEAASFGLYWSDVTKKEVKVSFSHSMSQKKEAISGDQWQHTGNKDSQRSQRWDQSIQATDEKNRDHWNQPSNIDSDQSSPFRRVDEFSPPHQIDKFGYLIPGASLLNFRFSGQPYSPEAAPAVYFRMGHRIEAKVIQPRDSKRSSIFQSIRAEDQPVILPWGFGQKAKDESVTGNYGGETDPDIVEKPEPEQPEIRESYLLMNVITTVVLPARTPLELPSMEISLDIDSFSWSFTGELWGASNIALVEPDENGPKQIEVDINGWKWIFIIERYSTNRRFGDERYTLYGSSRTQLLAAPYAPQRSKSNSANLNAKQAITEELANTGFTATYPDLNDYSTPDWIMPGGSFSYQNQTAMQVVAKIATTAGSVVIPSRDNDQVSIQPRYPASPWHWNTATMDKIVPASMVISLSANWRPEQAYNAVYVSGTNAGVAVNVKRTGSNGDNPAPDILEDWLTETQVNTERGRNELAKGGNQSITTIELPLTDTNTAPGLIEPGMLVEVQDITGDWQALCLATSISASGVGNVVQSVELERHY